MTNNLYHAAKKYVEVIEKIEKTTDPEELQKLEEARVDLHWKFIELLKKQGIKYKDREHATRIAVRIAHGEL
jgi:restriction endonuclease